MPPSNVRPAREWDSRNAQKGAGDEDTSLLREGIAVSDFGQVHCPCCRRAQARTLPWTISTLVFAVISVILFGNSLLPQSRPVSSAYGAALDTEMKPALAGSKLQGVQFGAPLAYNESGRLVVEHKAGSKVWVGEPAPELDALWDEVEAASILLLQGDEADMVRGRTTLYSGYWISGLDVFHQVHCLNMVRKGLYPEYYKPDGDERVHRLHIEHCLDYVRQALMCHGDASPVTHKWWPSAEVFAPDFETVHTCRDFEALRRWSLERTVDGRIASSDDGRLPQGGEVAKDADQVVGDEWLSHADHLGGVAG